MYSRDWPWGPERPAVLVTPTVSSSERRIATTNYYWRQTAVWQDLQTTKKHHFLGFLERLLEERMAGWSPS